MNAFSIAGAWSLGLGFFTRHWLAMTLLLVGLGIALPLALQYALLGGPIETVNLGRPAPDPYGNSWLVDRPVVIVVGSEGKGLSRLVTETCDQVVSIPITAVTESLNAGIAASVALYQVSTLRSAG
jgi:hypothetical protein